MNYRSLKRCGPITADGQQYFYGEENTHYTLEFLKIKDGNGFKPLLDVN
jgi:hypothetical protein